MTEALEWSGTRQSELRNPAQVSRSFEDSRVRHPGSASRTAVPIPDVRDLDLPAIGEYQLVIRRRPQPSR